MTELVERERPGGSPPGPIDGRDRWFPVVTFLAVAAALWVVVALSAAYLPREPLYPRPSQFTGGWLFEGWARWDAGWYRSIVRDGYVYYPGVQSSVAFWPAYPLAVRLLSGVFPSIYITGITLTVVAGFAAANLFYRWCLARMSRASARAALLVLLLYPYALYLFGPMYADAFCLACLLAAFVALERDHLWLAGLFGFVASAARPVGLLVAIALVVRLLELRNPDAVPLRARLSPRSLTARDLPVFLSFGGFASYCTYLWVRFGDPFLFETVQQVEGWNQGAGPRTWFKFFLVQELTTKTDWPSVWAKVAQGAFALAFLLLVPRIARRFGLAYAVLTAGVVIVPLIGTKDFMGTGRYLLVAFPAFAFLGEKLAERPVARRVVLTSSAIVLLFMVSLFGRGEYLA